PASNPAGGYREFGVDAIGIYADGYASDLAYTLVDDGYAGCGRDAEPSPEAADYVSGVVTPHASFLALEFMPDAALENLARLRADFAIYDEQFGFYDSVRVDTGVVARRFLALDQGMTLLAAANYLTDGTVRAYFASQIEPTVRPLLAQEIFGSSVD
ncbi:MAG: cellobiose phosphorylase, partial [Anaerolineae bacterium]|nr:cellobiose phosphorylase [Anaerolineae bacterium]